jgi:ribose transport system substrate-binding protein
MKQSWTLAPSGLRRRTLRMGALLLTAVSAVSLSGCSGVSDKQSTSPSASAGAGSPSKTFPVDRWDPTAAAGVKPDLPKRIGFINTFGASSLSGAFQAALTSAAKTEGLEVITTDPKNDSATAIQQANQLVQRGVVGLYDTMIAPEMVPPDLAAMKAGAMVGQFNQGPVTTMVSSIQYEGGFRVGEYTANYVKTKLAGKAQIAWISQDFNFSLKPRTQGFKDALAKAGMSDLLVANVTPPATPGATQAAGVAITNTLLEQHPKLDVIAASGDDLALGAATALKSAGKVTPTTMTVGIDGTEPALAAIQSGKSAFKATVAVNFPFAAYLPGRLFGRWSKGLTVPQYLVFNYALVDSPEGAARLQKDSSLAELPRVYDELLAGDDTYVTPLGSISYATRDAYYDGTVPDKLPPLSFTPKFKTQ